MLNCELVSKWGLDGSSGHSEYKQKSTTGTLDDSSIFCTTLVPLQLKFKDSILYGQDSVDLFTSRKETSDLSQEENQSVQNEINKINYELAADQNTGCPRILPCFRKILKISNQQ